MSTLLLLLALGSSYFMGLFKSRADYKSLRADFVTLVHEDAQVISEYRKHIRHLESEVSRLERLANG